jgi:hypothetical protein
VLVKADAPAGGVPCVSGHKRQAGRSIIDKSCVRQPWSGGVGQALSIHMQACNSVDGPATTLRLLLCCWQQHACPTRHPACQPAPPHPPTHRLVLAFLRGSTVIAAHTSGASDSPSLQAWHTRFSLNLRQQWQGGGWQLQRRRRAAGVATGAAAGSRASSWRAS